MRQIVKQVAGIDVAQKELVVSLGKMYNCLTAEVFTTKVFANTEKGYEALLSWVKQLMIQDVPVRFVMEATGVYHESLAFFLDDNEQEVTIVLPSKISNYVKTLEVKTVTDKTASQSIALFGLERKLDCWQRPKTLFKKLRQLTRERNQLVDESTVIKNQLHADMTEAHPNKATLERTKKRIAFLNKQQAEIKAEISLLLKEDKEMQQLLVLLCSITGIGTLTAVTILAETNGFELIRNKKQLSSYAGLDVKEKQSGTSVKTKPKISKRGNKYLRKAMHMPALTAIRRDERFKAIFARLVSKHGIKMKAVIAVQRKLLEMAYTVYKSQVKYDKLYLTKQEPVLADV
jgi:transposase